MKKTRHIILIAALGVLIPGLAFAMPWSWDMFTQPSHKAQESKGLDYPEGIVPTKGKAVEPANREASKKLKNPIPLSQGSIDRGRVKYRIYCATCHGTRGRGDGLVGKKYVPPTDLTGAYIQKERTEGEIYFTITNGGLAIMPHYADSLEYEDRWHIVNYIKHAIKDE